MAIVTQWRRGVYGSLRVTLASARAAARSGKQRPPGGRADGRAAGWCAARHTAATFIPQSASKAEDLHRGVASKERAAPAISEVTDKRGAREDCGWFAR